MVKFIRLSFIAALIMGVASCGGASAAAKKPAPKKVVKKSVSLVGPKILSVVAGQPFEQIPATGSSKISVSLCADETESATFTVRYGKTLPGVVASVANDFVGPVKLAKSCFSISKVSGDDLVNGVANSGLEVATADIGPSPTQFWLDVSVPRNTRPGIYKGAVSFVYQGKVLDVASVSVQVFPLRLIGSSKQYAVFTPYGPGVDGMDVNSYSQLLSEFRKAGMRVVSISADSASCADAMATYVKAGLSGPVPILRYAFDSEVPSIADVSALDAARRSSGVPSALYFCKDLPTTPEDITTAQGQLQAFHYSRLLAVARVADNSAVEALSPNLDGISYSVDTKYVQSLLSGETKRTSSKWEWMWWNARLSSTQNRIYAGVGVWKAGLDGCMPCWMPEEGKDADTGISSIQTAALREGVDDTRYMTTFMKALRELKDLKRQKDKDYIDQVESYLTNFLSKPVNSIRPSDLRTLRSKLADYSIKMNAML